MIFIPSLYIIDLLKHTLISRIQKLFVVITGSIALAGIFLLLFGNNEPKTIAVSISCFLPCYHLILYLTMLNGFIRKFKKHPVDTAYNNSPDLIPDRIFAIAFCLISIFSSLAIISPFIWRIGNP